MKYLILPFLLLITFFTEAATISSKSSGGDWNSTSTWIGNNIPTAADDVIINGTVAGAGSCKSLTVSSGATLLNRSGYGETIVINGDITNNGTIQNAASGSLYLNVYGRITNNGTWNNRYIYLYQTGNAHLSQASGKYFENLTLEAANGKADSIVMQTDVMFKACNYTSKGTNKRVLVADQTRLNIINCTVNSFNIQTNDTVDLKNSTITGCTIYGKGTISGTVHIKSGSTIEGSITNAGILKNASGYGVATTFKGDITNNGTITNAISGSLEVYLANNFTNNGIYSPAYTQFKTGNSHRLSQEKGKFLTGQFYNIDTDSIILASDLEFKKATFTGVSSLNIIKANNFKLIFDSSSVQGMTVLSNDTIGLNGSLLTNTTLMGTLATTGTFRLHGNSSFLGTVSNHGVIYNSQGYGVTTKILGQFINYGEIGMHPKSGGHYLQLDANIENHGIYRPNSSLLLGATLHTFRQNDTSSFQGTFYTQDTSGGILLGSDITFRNATISWTDVAPYSSFVTDGNKLNLIDCDVWRVRFNSKDTLNLNGSRLTNIRTVKTPEIIGKVIFHNNVVIRDGFINHDTIYQSSGYGVTTHVHGTLTNKGLISNNPKSGSFSIHLHDAIHNEGTYGPLYTYFSGDQPVEMSQSANTNYTGTYYAADTSNGLRLASNVTFKKITFNGTDMVPFASFHSLGHQLTLDSCNISELRLFGNDTIHGNGTKFSNVSSFDFPIFTGLLTVHSGVHFRRGCVNLGTIENSSGYGRTVKVEGKLHNYGTIRTHPKSGSLTMDLHGDLYNAGTYHPSYTYTSGGVPRIFSQEPNTAFEGTYHASDTADGITLGTDVRFKQVEINWHDVKPYSALNTMGFTLHLDSSNAHELHIKGADTLNLNGTVLSKTEISGMPIIAGTVTVHSGVTFHSPLNNLGTIQNTQGYGITTIFEDDIENNGYIKTNPNGGSYTANISGNITNNAFMELGYIDFVGNRTRTISGANIKALSATCTIKDSMAFKGECYLPNLNILHPHILTIDTSSSLVCDAINSGALSRIKNYGSVRSKKGSSSWQEVTYLNASLRYHNVNISDLLVETYGHQQHPTTEGAINTWWRLRPTPQLATDSLKELNLSFQSADLNNNSPQDLKVYFTPNAGLSWRKITDNVMVDTATENVRILDAPSYGHYVLSSKDLGILAFKPIIQRAEPKVFGNKGHVTIYGFGIGLTKDMTVTLKRAGSANITADTSYLTDGIGESFIAIFNVDLADIGTYSMHIEISGETPIELTDYFTVEEAERPDPWVMLSGRDRFLINRWQTFKINYGNLSNVDAEGVPLFFVIKDIAGLEVDFPDVQIGVPKSFTDDGWTQWKDTVIDLFYVSDSLNGFEGQRMRVYPFYLPSIGALSANSVRVKVKAPSDIEMTVWLTDPLLEGFEKQKKATTPPEVAACLAKVAAKYSWDKAIDLVPGYDCYKLAYKVTETGANHILKDPNEKEKPETWGSWLISGWGWAWSIADCAGDIIPVTKGVKIAKDLIGIGFDIKGNYDATQDCWNKFKRKSKGKHKSRGVSSFDPNEITGPGGYGQDHYINANTNMVYTVFFENKDTAKAPATDVIVYDTLETTKFDFSTFSFNSVTIADSTYDIQAFSKEFSLLIDLSPRINTIVQVLGSLDTTNGVIQVGYYTLDRSTLEPSEDVDLGFLPPNKSAPEGEGNFSYSVALKSSLTHDDEIKNSANIFFDANKPIATNVHTNKIDKLSPESMVSTLATTTTDSTFIVTWSGSDQGCGIQNYSVFVAINDSAYIAWRSNTSLTSDTFYGRDKYNYKFYTIATDSLGLTERVPDQPDTETDVIDKSDIENMSGGQKLAIYPNPAHSFITVAIDGKPIGQCKIYTLDGQLIKRTSLIQNETKINITDVRPNIYVAEVITETQVVRRKIEIID